jgi:hypothetical protein
MIEDMDDTERFVRTEKVFHNEVIYAVNVTFHRHAFFSSWRCMRCDATWISPHGQATAGDASAQARGTIDEHQSKFHH